DAGDLAAQLDVALAPFLARTATPGALLAPRAPGGEPLVLPSDDLLESAVQSSAALGAELVDEHARCARLDREAESLRTLSDALRASGASFDRTGVVTTALGAAITTLGAAAAAICTLDAKGALHLDGAAGRDLAALLNDPESSSLLARMLTGSGPSVIEDLAA